MGREQLRRGVMTFTRGASVEVCPHDEPLLPTLASYLLPGTTVYVAHTPKASLEDVVRVAVKVESLGFPASPHIAARRLPNGRALRQALRELTDAGVEQILLIAGDVERPAGTFAGTLEVLETGILQGSEIKRLGVAGHPEGHKTIGAAKLWQALLAKQAFADRTGIATHIVTQFSFNPHAVCTWARYLSEHGISLPVHVGMSGPTSLPKLIRFAMQCGVKASLHTLMGNLSAMNHLVRPATTPDAALLGLARERAACDRHPIVHAHFYSFGGVVATARYVRAIVDGRFDLNPDDSEFLLGS